MPRRAVPPPPGGRKRRAGAAKAKAPERGTLMARTRARRHQSKSGGGIDLPKFASEVSRNYARGAAAVGRHFDQSHSSRGASSSVSKAMSDAEQARAALRKALGK